MTPLQTYLAALHDLLADAREEMTKIEWATFVEIGCEIVGIEAAKMLVRELRAEGEERAA